MPKTNVYELESLASRGVSDLGCVMLDVDSYADMAHLLPPAWLYHSDTPGKEQINGTLQELHVTLKYGLIDNANLIRDDIDRVMDGWTPGALIAKPYPKVFASPYEDEPYSCIAAELELTPELCDANARLSMLPHVDLYPSYTPHVTLTYVRRECQPKAVNLFHDFMTHQSPIMFMPVGLNYGDPA